MPIQLPGIKAKTHELIAAAEIEADLDTVPDSMPPGDFLDSLMVTGQWADGVRLLRLRDDARAGHRVGL